jgi:hypothetical protein
MVDQQVPDEIGSQRPPPPPRRELCDVLAVALRLAPDEDFET